MKRNNLIALITLCFVVVVATTAEANWSKTGSNSYSYSLDGKLAGTVNGTTVTYELSLSPPEGSFKQPSSFTNCSKVIDSPGQVKARKVFDVIQASDSDYSFSMGGELLIAGDGEGTVSWSAGVELEKPFLVYPKEGNVSVGEHPSITISATENADWSLGNKTNQSSVSIYVEGDPQAPTTAIKVPSGQDQTISASPTGKTSPSDSATFTICRTQSYDEKTWAVSALNSFTLNDATRGAINNIASRFGVNLAISTVGASLKTKTRTVCCDEGTLVREESQTQKSAGVGFQIAQKIALPGLAIPSVNKSGSKNGITYNIDIALGVYLVPGDIMFSVEQTTTENACEETSCDMWGLSGEVSPGIWAGAQSIVAISLLGYSGACELEANASTTVRLSLSGTYSTGECEETGLGFHGSVGKIEGSIQVVLDGLTLITYKQTFLEGFSW